MGRVPIAKRQTNRLYVCFKNGLTLKIMKCMLCEKYSLSHICNSCQKTFLQPSLYKRKLESGVEIISFYTYEEIKKLLHTKHTDLGYYIYTILAELSFKKFAEEFHTKEKYVSLAIDDTITSGYSHTAILNKKLTTYNIKPLFHKIRAQNKVSYSGKSKIFRKMNPRHYKINPFKEKNIILVDDIVTTGATLEEAVNSLNKEYKSVAFCLTLADANREKNIT